LDIDIMTSNHATEAEDYSSTAPPEKMYGTSPVGDTHKVNKPGEMNDKDIKPANATNSTPDFEYPSTWKATLIVAALFLAVFLVALDQTIIGTAIPRITDQFESVGDVGWYGSAYFLTSTALMPSFGRIYKIFDVGLFAKIVCRYTPAKTGTDQMELLGRHLRL
jgi:hypothetical protein